MSYADLTNSFAYKDLLSFTKMDSLAANDAYDVFRAGTVTVFYQSTLPAGWTKQAGFNDSALRVVAGATGGTTGGSTGLSSTITIGHSHSNQVHTHSVYDHSHNMASAGVAGAQDFSFNDQRVVRNNSTLVVRNTSGAGSVSHNYAGAGTDTSGSLNAPTSDAAGTTNSQLSDVAFAYCDMIIASKDA